MQRKDLYYVICIGLLLIALFVRGCNNKPNTESVTQKTAYKYITDTIEVDKGFEEKYNEMLYLYKKAKQTPPLTVTYYKTLDPENIYIEKIPDSILLKIDSLEQRILISNKYLKNFPKADKLISFDLQKDSLKITTLNISGQTIKKDYPLYFNLFKYSWYDNELHNIKTKDLTKTKKNILNQLYLNGGYDFINQKPTIGGEYFILLSRFKIEAISEFTIEPTPKLSAGAKLGYRLF